jgi:hypothetical protein
MLCPAMFSWRSELAKHNFFCFRQVYSLPAMERLQCIPTDTPINYTAMSPDMQRLAAVGDTPQL